MMIDDDSISKREKGTAEKFEKKIELLENRVKEFEKKEEVELKKIKINDSIKSALKKDSIYQEEKKIQFKNSSPTVSEKKNKIIESKIEVPKPKVIEKVKIENSIPKKIETENKRGLEVNTILQ
ncbi:hypothetical protein [Empedobacter sp. ULE_I140]